MKGRASLRRKSIMVRQSNISLLEENDDEAERLARRNEIALPSINAADRRRSLGLSILNNMSSSEMVEGVSQCIKLGAENKINIKNAFSLRMIDFMTYMIRKHDSNMDDLQMASVSLDVSTKIYGFRVDGVHMEILKMAGGLDKQASPMQTQNIDENNEVQTKKKTKKKTLKKQILTTVESLRTNVQTVKPTLPSMESDLETSDRLLQVMLPHHAGSGFYPHPYNEILVDTVEHKETRDTDTCYSIPKIKDISKMKICPLMSHFDFLNTDLDDEPEDAEPEKMNENTFHFDLDAPLQDSTQSYIGIHYSDTEDNEEENVERCVNLPNEVENIVNFQPLMSSDVVSKPSEYSVIPQTLNMHWRGPSYWNPANTGKLINVSKSDEKCFQQRKRKRKEVELCYDLESEERARAKFVQSKNIKTNSKTISLEWSESKVTLPVDKHYDIGQASQFYLHPMKFQPPKNTDEMNTTHLSDIVTNDDYDYDNNASNYCPQTNVNEYQETENNNAILDGAVSTNDYVIPSQTLSGANLVPMPPTLINKIHIPHCTRAKKIDMKVLKHTIWKSLCTNSDQHDMEVDTRGNGNLQNSDKMSGTKNFIEIHKKLPTLLTKNNAEALSFPISFVSLLHLANEKSLQITSSPDTNDLIVKQD